MAGETPTLERKAAEVGALVGPVLGEGGYKFDPSVIIAAVLALIRMFTKDCNFSPAEARAKAQRPGLLGRFMVRRVVREKAKRAPKEAREALEAALLDAGEQVTDDEMQALYAEAEQ